MPGLLDPMQRLALMMAIMVLGMPQVHSCHTSTNRETPWGGEMSDLRICLPVMPGNEMKISTVGERLDPSHWRKLPAIHCQATHSTLTFMCGLDGRTNGVRYEKFRQPCGIQPAACWGALKSDKLKVGEQEYPVAMNTTRSHMTGIEDCSGGWKLRAGSLNRKINQRLMEVRFESEWIWWDKEKGQVTTASGKAAAVYKDGEAVMEDRLWMWTAPPRVGGANLPADGGGAATFNLVKIYSGRNTGPVRLLLQCSGGVCRGGYFLLPNRE
jgi:hypothetical protein